MSERNKGGVFSTLTKSEFLVLMRTLNSDQELFPDVSLDNMDQSEQSEVVSGSTPELVKL